MGAGREPMLRREDRALLTRGGTYVADIGDPLLDGALHVHFVRADVASAHIVAIECDDARAMPGVVAVFTGDDVDIGPMPPVLPRCDAVFSPPVLATNQVRHVGEAVAAVVAASAAQAADAAERVWVRLDDTPVVADVWQALDDDILVIAEVGTNVVASSAIGDDEPATLFDDCDVVVRVTATHPRVAACPLETRAAASVWQDGRLHHWVSTQGPLGVRRSLAAAFAVPESQVRVVAPDVGGGFGPKFAHYVEDVLVAWIARRLDRPVRWAESRRESMVGLHHGRAQAHEITLGGTRDGTIRAYRLDVVQDSGAYASLGAYAPDATLRMTTGVYRIARAHATSRALLTNTTPVSAYRGTGRPEATCAIERAIDRYAHTIGLDPVALRRRNLVGDDEFPFTTPVGTVYDSGRYGFALARACEVAGYEALRAEQQHRRDAHRNDMLGIGVCAYVESTGAGPAMEFATVTIDGRGDVVVRTGSSPHGQGHETTWAQLVADALGVGAAHIEVRHGDTDEVAAGLGTFASRSTQFAGSAVVRAAAQLVDRARSLGAQQLEAAEADIVFDRGRGTFAVAGAPARTIGWAALVSASGEVELRADVMFTGAMTFPFGAHIAVVEVDRETGGVRLMRHIAVDDAGTLVHPMIAEGQVHGGVAQGAGEALHEEFRYDERATPLTTNLADYTIPAATELPSFETTFTETPAPSNPLGAKGVGESGVIGAVAAIQNAVCDAVAHLGVDHVDIPLTPERVWRALRDADERGVRSR